MPSVLLPSTEMTWAADCRMNLQNIGLALQNFHDTYTEFPPAASRDPQGKKLLSWRVHLLPFVVERELYRQFHLDEPWDSPHNRSLIGRMPDVYRCVAAGVEPGQTLYMAAVGDETMFPTSLEARRMRDGTGETVLVLEASKRHAVTWTEPEDLLHDSEDFSEKLGDHHLRGFYALFVDGHVELMSLRADGDRIHGLCVRSEPGEDATADEGEINCKGELLAIRSHQGELHILVAADGANEMMGGPPVIEFATRDKDLVSAMSDYWSDEDAWVKDDGSQADEILVEGLVSRDFSTSLWLGAGIIAASSVAELRMVQRVDEPTSRAVAGKSRDENTFRSDKKLGSLEKIMRFHPPPETPVEFPAYVVQQNGSTLLVAPFGARATPEAGTSSAKDALGYGQNYETPARVGMGLGGMAIPQETGPPAMSGYGGAMSGYGGADRMVGGYGEMQLPQQVGVNLRYWTSKRLQKLNVASEKNLAIAELRFLEVSPDSFTDYLPDDSVDVVASVSEASTPSRLVLAGTRLVRKADPSSLITHEGRATAPRDLASELARLRETVERPDQQFGKTLEMVGVYHGSETSPQSKVSIAPRCIGKQVVSIPYEPTEGSAGFLDSLTPGEEILFEVTIAHAELGPAPTFPAEQQLSAALPFLARSGQLFSIARCAKPNEKLVFPSADPKNLFGSNVLSIPAETTQQRMDVMSEMEYGQFGGVVGRQNRVAWSPDGSHLAATRGGFAGEVWETREGKRAHILSGHSGVVTDIVWDPVSDVPRIATSCEDGTIKIWDANNGTEVRSVEPDLKDFWERRRQSQSGGPLAGAEMFERGRGSVAGRSQQRLPVRLLSWRHDGESIATTMDSGVLYFFNPSSPGKGQARHSRFGQFSSVRWNPGANESTAGYVPGQETRPDLEPEGQTPRSCFCGAWVQHYYSCEILARKTGQRSRLVIIAQ